MQRQTVAAYSQSLSQSARHGEAQPVADLSDATASLRFSQHLDGPPGPPRSPITTIAPSAWGSVNAPPERLLASAGFFGGFDGERDAFGPEDSGREDDFLDDDVARAAAALVSRESAASSRGRRRRSSPLSRPRSLSPPRRSATSPQPFYSDADEDEEEEDEEAAAAEARGQLAAAVAANPLMRLPPGLPNVDAHVANPALHYAKLVTQRGFKRRPHRPSTDGDARRRPTSSDGDVAGNFTVGQIRAVVNYIDDLGPSAAGGTAGDGGVDAHELEFAFRRARRSR